MTIWPPSGVVKSPAQIVGLMDFVLAVCRRREKGPVVVQCRYKLAPHAPASHQCKLFIYFHCLSTSSDTVGRSGMYCAISNALEQCKAEGVVDVFQVVKAIRMQKPGAVTTQVKWKCPTLQIGESQN